MTTVDAARGAAPGVETPGIAAADIYPDTTRVDTDGRVFVGGCDLEVLAATYGTPLYVYDRETIVDRARSFRVGLAGAYPGRSTVCYASKAYSAPWLLRLLASEGIGLDVVSGGELHVAMSVGFPSERIYLHGNNKSDEELEAALDVGIGRVVVDNLDEIALLGRMASKRGVRQPVLVRVSPGVDAHTHAHLHTGGLDTKFGLGIATGQAAEGVRAALAEPGLDVRGIHAHIGSQIDDLGPYAAALQRLFDFAAEMERETAFRLRELSPGGGYAVRYVPTATPVSARHMVAALGELVAAAADRAGLREGLPALTIEPGRSMVAPSAVAVYRVGSVKAIPGGRTYVAVDGGMADNIRPTAYGAEYTAVLAGRAHEPADTEVAIAGKYCETGDVLIQRIELPRPRVGDVVAIPAAGAYHLAMASNYNMAPRPAVIVVADGEATLVRRRETYADLLAAEDPAPA